MLYILWEQNGLELTSYLRYEQSCTYPWRLLLSSFARASHAKGKEKTYIGCIYTLNNHRKEINTQIIRKNLNITAGGILKYFIDIQYIMQCNARSSLCPFTSLWAHSMQRGNTLPSSTTTGTGRKSSGIILSPAQRQVEPDSIARFIFWTKCALE